MRSRSWTVSNARQELLLPHQAVLFAVRVLLLLNTNRCTLPQAVKRALMATCVMANRCGRAQLVHGVLAAFGATALRAI